MQKRSAAAGLVAGLIIGVGVPGWAAVSHDGSTYQRHDTSITTHMTRAERLQWYENHYAALRALAASWRSSDAARPGVTIQARTAAEELTATMQSR